MHERRSGSATEGYQTEIAMDVWETLDALPPDLRQRVHETLREVAGDVGLAEEAGALSRSRRLSIRVGPLLADVEVNLPRRSVVLLGLLNAKGAPGRGR